MRLGIISALQEEQAGIVEAIEGKQSSVHGMRTYTTGTLWECDVVCVLSRIGKVAAATTATTLIERFGVTHILFTGVAGAGNPDIKVGDVVIADNLVQYDMDASPLFPRFEVPLTGQSYFQTDPMLTSLLVAATRDLSVHRGLIASGDQFINDIGRLQAIRMGLPGVLAVEMEGAAVAQVCYELGVPCAVVRTISDNANEEAATDFMEFVKNVAARYAFAMIKSTLHQLAHNRSLGS